MKTKFFFSLICCTILLTSCNVNDEHHSTMFSKQNVLMYADQEEDSVFFACTDPWKITAYEDWLTIDPLELKAIPSGAVNSVTKLTITTTANNTGKMRKSIVEINTFQPAGFYIQQYSWLNINMTGGVSEKDGDGNMKMNFRAVAPGMQHVTTVYFTVYKDGATLTSNADWVTLEESTFDKGEHEVKVNIAANPSEEERKAILTLTSNGVSTPIEIPQRPKVVE